MDRLFGGPASPSAERLLELDEFCGPDALTLQRLAEVFEQSAALLTPYSDGSINQAFWGLGSNVFSAIGDDSIDWALRQRVIHSFEILFRNFFAVRCQPVLGHLSEEGSPLNLACYMWWDFDCRYSTPDAPLLAVMRSTLTIDHIACQEALSTVLAIWHDRCATEVEIIIVEFLGREHRFAPS